MFLINDLEVTESRFREVLNDIVVWLEGIEQFKLYFISADRPEVTVTLDLQKLMGDPTTYIKLESNIPYKIAYLPITSGKAYYV